MKQGQYVAPEYKQFLKTEISRLIQTGQTKTNIAKRLDISRSYMDKLINETNNSN